MQEIYSQAAARGKVTDEQLVQIMKDNEELGLHLHMESYSGRGGDSFMKATPMDGSRYTNIYENGVAVIDMIGPIYPRANMMTMSGGMSVAQFTNDFIKAYTNNAVSGIVIHSDSPGGDMRGIGDASMLMHRLVQSGKKPVKTFASGYLASAAYYLGSVAQEVVGSKSSVTGSIGTVLTTRAAEKGEIEIVSSQSPNKRPDPSTDEGRAVLQQKVDDLAEIMIGDIAKNRGITPERVMSHYGQGDTMIGPRAKKLGLLDSLGTLSSTVEAVAKESEQPKGRVSVRQSYEAVTSTTLDDVLKFTEEDNMGFKDLLNKFTASGETTDDEAQVAEPIAGESNESTAAEGQEDVQAVIEPTVSTVAPNVPQAFNREELTERFQAGAEDFAEKMVLASKIDPAQAAHVAVDLINAQIDDTITGTMVQFITAEGRVAEGTREAAVRAKYNAWPKHTMTQEAVKSVKNGSVVAQVLAEGDPEKVTDGPVSPERRKELLGLTSQGQAVLANSNNN
jgi:ClpP class serine protease